MTDCHKSLTLDTPSIINALTESFTLSMTIPSCASTPCYRLTRLHAEIWRPAFENVAPRPIRTVPLHESGLIWWAGNYLKVACPDSRAVQLTRGKADESFMIKQSRQFNKRFFNRARRSTQRCGAVPKSCINASGKKYKRIQAPFSQQTIFISVKIIMAYCLISSKCNCWCIICCLVCRYWVSVYKALAVLFSKMYLSFVLGCT